MNSSELSPPSSEVAPVLITCFNRPDETATLLRILRQVAPGKVYVSVDGPRSGRPSDIPLCAEVKRLIASEINWPCLVKTRFSEENLGCRDGMMAGISWFFDQEPYGIILEDDCHPDPSFIPFASALLKRYQPDKSIVQVCGSNEGGTSSIEDDYFLSLFGGIWGWATWADRWQAFRSWHAPGRGPAHFLRKMRGFRSLQALRAFNARVVSAKGPLNSWGYLWGDYRISTGGLSLVPRINLIRNVGFNDSATHTNKDSDSRHSRAAGSLVHFRHPAHGPQRNPAFEAFIRKSL